MTRGVLTMTTIRRKTLSSVAEAKTFIKITVFAKGIERDGIDKEDLISRLTDKRITKNHAIEAISQLKSEGVIEEI